MNKLNTILFIILMLLLTGKVFATSIKPVVNYKDKQDIIEYQSLQEIEDLLCDDSCDDVLQDQIDSIELDNE